MKVRHILNVLAVCALFLICSPVGAQQTTHNQQVLEFRSRLKQLPRDQEAKVEPQIKRGYATAAPGTVVMQIEFPLGSAEIPEEYRRVAHALGDAIIGDPFLKDNIFIVEGHTCNLGSVQINQVLAGKRAEAFVDYLVRSFRIPRDHFRIENYGPTRPLNSNKTGEERKQNRRVVVRNTFENVRLGAALKMIDERGAIVTVNTNIDMKTGQKYALEITPREPLYTHVCRILLDGDVQQLFPNPSFAKQENPLLPESMYRLPAFGRWFEMKGSTREELLIAIGSDEGPVGNPMAMCCQLAGYVIGETWGSGVARGIAGTTTVSVSQTRSDNALRGRCGVAQSKGIGGVVTIPTAPQGAPSETSPTSAAQVVQSPQDITVWIRMFRHVSNTSSQLP